MRTVSRLRPGLALALAVLSGPATALDPHRAVTQHVLTGWVTGEGVPHSNIEAILQTRDGYLWLGTQSGLVRFDGIRFVTFDKRSTPAIRHNWVSGLAEHPDGSLWFSMLGGGVGRLHRGTFTSFSAAEGLASDQVYSLEIDPDGSVWAATLGGGLHHLVNGRFTRLTKADGLPNDNVFIVRHDDAGSLWVGGNQWMARLKQGKLTLLGAADGLPPGQVRTLVRETDGTLLVGIAEGTVCRLSTADARLSTQGLPEPGSFGRMRTLVRDRDGNLWIGTIGRGLARWRDGRLSFLTTQHGLATDEVASMLEDREGNLWVGLLLGGLARLRDGPFVAVGPPEGLSSHNVRAVFEDSRGALWMATPKGLNRWKDGVATVFTTKDGLTHDVVASLAEIPEGRLLVGLRGEGLDVYDGTRFSSLEKARLANGQVTHVLPSRDGSLWIATSGGGLHRRSPDGQLTVLSKKDGLPNDFVLCLLEDGGGALWFGTFGGGLCSLAGGRVSCLSTKDGLGAGIVAALHQDAAGTLWIATAGGGVSRLKDGRLKSCGSREGLPDDTIYTILEDGRGNLWMGSSSGPFRVEKAALEAVLDGRSPSVTARLYDTADGLRGTEGNGGSQPSGFRARDGRLWFPTSRGAASVDPERAGRLAPPPAARVEELTADGKPYALIPEAPAVLPAGTQNLEVRYTALTLGAPERVRFRYRLEGFDPGWIEAGKRRVAYYTNVPPDRYSFRVEASGDDGLFGDAAAASLALEVRPFLYQTRWFAGLCLALAAAAGYGAFRLRLRRLVRRQAELESLVEARTADLRKAQEQIEKLSSSMADVLEDPAGWAEAIASQVAKAIGAKEIGVFVLEGERVLPLASRGTQAPTAERIRGSFEVTPHEGSLVPVLSMTGEPRGALVVEAAGRELKEADRRLLTGFAQHLGMALDLRHLREKLSAAEARRAATRQELHERGVQTLLVCRSCGLCYDETARACEADGAGLDDSRVLPLVVQDRYRLTRLLGEGGMGSVFSARDQRLERLVAVKVIRSRHLADLDARLRFEREARTVARIHHPSVIALHDSGELEDGSAFLVMELLEGRTLAGVLASFGPGSFGQVASLLAQAGSGLSAAHALPVIHRDVKPENLFLTPVPGGFQVKLLDFGLAKTGFGDARLTRTGVVLGTPAYMSPEQVQGLPLDERSDLYSLAAVVYEALSGRAVSGGGDETSILMEVLTGKPPRLSELVPGVPRELDVAFARALAKEPSRRPPSVEAWVKVVAPLLEALPPVGGKGRWPLHLSGGTRVPADPSAKTRVS